MKEEKGIYLGLGNSNDTRPICVEYNKNNKNNFFEIGQVGRGMGFSAIHNLLNTMENENSIIITDPKNDF